MRQEDRTHGATERIPCQVDKLETVPENKNPRVSWVSEQLIMDQGRLLGPYTSLLNFQQLMDSGGGKTIVLSYMSKNELTRLQWIVPKLWPYIRFRLKPEDPQKTKKT